MMMMMRRNDQCKPENAEPCMHYESEKGNEYFSKPRRKITKTPPTPYKSQQPMLRLVQIVLRRNKSA